MPYWQTLASECLETPPFPAECCIETPHGADAESITSCVPGFPHVCITRVGEPKHKDSHICFGKHVPISLNPIEAAGCIAVLEDAVSKLQIIAQTSTTDTSVPEEKLYSNPEDQFSQQLLEPDRVKYREFAGLWPVDVEAMIKLQKDRRYAETVLHKTLEDIRSCNKFGALLSAVGSQIALEADETTLLERIKSGSEKEANYKELLTTEKDLMMKQDKFWDKKTEELLASYHDTRLISGLTLQFARKWEETRRQQLNQRGHLRETALRNDIDEILENSLIDEERAHMEIANFLHEEHTNLKNDLDHWTDVYDEELATREAEIANLRQNKEANVDALESAKSELERRAQVMADALELREKHEKKKFAENQVRTIQAWWRGIYHRKNLAKKAKKLVKKGKKGKKGKGKKDKKKKS